MNNVVYIDRLCFSSLLKLALSAAKHSRVFYFDSSEKITKAANFAARFKLLKAEPQPLKFQVRDITNEQGEIIATKILEDIRDICFSISDKELGRNIFLKRFYRHFDSRKLLLFFEKVVENDIKNSVVLTNAARWHAMDKLKLSGAAVLFFTEKGLWSRYISLYAASLNIRTVEYRPIINSSYQDLLGRAWKTMASMAKRRIRASGNVASTNVVKRAQQPEALYSKSPLLAAWYTGKIIGFGLKERIDFFWLLKSEIPRKQVMIYFDRVDVPLTDESLKALQDEQINFVALSEKATTAYDAPVWRSGDQYKRLNKYFLRLVALNYFLCLLKPGKLSPFFIVHMVHFVRQYSYWHDFFTSNNIKINFSPNDFTKNYAPKNLALEKAGGVSVSYQWTNLQYSSVQLSGMSDVMFAFGPDYRCVWENNRSAIDHLIYSGYITDYAFSEVRRSSLALREQLHDRGVNFILCFFDENSSDERMSVITHNSAIIIYKFLLERMLDDGTLGLIFKPGYPTTLYERLAPISRLIEKGKASGRCIFVERGDYLTDKYPAEAAQAADLCVGLLLSGTVAMEAYLSGTPTVFLDVEKLYSNPIYKWGKGKVVFNSLDSLFSAIQQIRTNPVSIPGFGDLSPWVKDKDIFRDGNASLRIGQYLGWLMETFNQGGRREDAIDYANRKYEEAWGKDNIAQIAIKSRT